MLIHSVTLQLIFRRRYKSAAVLIALMLSWALGTSVLSRGETSSTSTPASKNCGGFKQLGSTKRQKPQPREAGCG